MTTTTFEPMGMLDILARHRAKEQKKVADTAIKEQAEQVYVPSALDLAITPSWAVQKDEFSEFF